MASTNRKARSRKAHMKGYATTAVKRTAQYLKAASRGATLVKMEDWA